MINRQWIGLKSLIKSILNFISKNIAHAFNLSVVKNLYAIVAYILYIKYMCVYCIMANNLLTQMLS